MFWISFFAVWVFADEQPWQLLVESRLQRQNDCLAALNPETMPDALVAAYLLTLGQNGDPSGLDRIRSFFGNERHQRTALFAYGEVTGAPLQPLLDWADKVAPGNLLTLIEAASKLARAKDAANVAALWTDLSPEFRNRALFYLWRVKTDGLTGAVIAHLRQGTGTSENGYVYYLYRSRTQIPADLLLAIIHRVKQNPQSLNYATRIRPEQPTPTWEKNMAALCFARDWRARVNGLNALGDNALKQSRGLALLNDANPNVRRTAIAVLVGLEDETLDRELAMTPGSFSPSQLQTMLARANPQQSARFYPLVAHWGDSSATWERRKWLGFLAKAGGPPAETRLKQALQHPASGEAVLALDALTQRTETPPEGLFTRVFNTGDPYLMATAVRALARYPEPPKGLFSFEKLQDLARGSLAEPDFHYQWIDRLATLADEPHRMEALAELRRHQDYPVRLKALSATPDPTPAMGAQVFQSPWRAGVPEEVKQMAARFMAGGEKRAWHVETTKGKIEISLWTSAAPITTANIVHLGKIGYFDHMPIHRVVPNFVVQAGDSRGDGSGGPGYAIPCEINPNPYRRGTVGMALAGKDTGGSQFFICHADQPHLDGGYTTFGEVVSGMEIVDRLEEGDLIMKTFVH